MSHDAVTCRWHYYYMRRVKEAIHVRIHPNNINKDSGIEIPEAWMPTIKKHNNRRAVRQRTAEGANHWVNSKDRNAPIRAVWKTTNHSRASCFIRSHMTSRPHRLKKTSSMQLKCRDLHHMWLHCETNEKISFYYYWQSGKKMSLDKSLQIHAKNWKIIWTLELAIFTLFHVSKLVLVQ